MAESFNRYVGNGVTVLYPFTFEYLEPSDIYVTLGLQLNTDWTLTSATEITFNTAPAVDVKITIFRQTDLDAMQAVFAAASAIRARDLNDDFTQLRLAILESRGTISPEMVVELDERYWQKEAETVYATDTWVANDTTIATTEAIQNYVLSSEQTGIPEAPADGLQYGRQDNTWTRVAGAEGGIEYLGTRDLTLPAPTSNVEGDLWINVATTGVVNASWVGIAGETLRGSERVIYNGSEWDMLPMPATDGVETVIAGNNITVNNSDPQNPVISANDQTVTITAGDNITVTAGPTVAVTPNSFLPYNLSTLPVLP